MRFQPTSYKTILGFTVCFALLSAAAKSASIKLARPTTADQAKVVIPDDDRGFFIVDELDQPTLAENSSKAQRAALTADFEEFGTERISNSNLPTQFLHGLPQLAVLDDLPVMLSQEFVLGSPIDRIDSAQGSIPRGKGALLIPEPAAPVLFSIGLVGLLIRRRHRPVRRGH